jgi:nicotinamide-nucleotide amidase
MNMATLESLAIEVNKVLKEKGLKLTTAESCTGGGIGYWMTSVPGSSACFERGFITYSNEAKIEQLGVDPLSLEVFGAVSEQVAREMAEGALRHSNADVSIAITGIAGPDGGTPDKPVGTVWVAFASCTGSTQAVVDVFSGNRQEIRNLAIEKAFGFLMSCL